VAVLPVSTNRIVGPGGSNMRPMGVTALERVLTMALMKTNWNGARADANVLSEMIMKYASDGRNDLALQGLAELMVLTEKWLSLMMSLNAALSKRGYRAEYADLPNRINSMLSVKEWADAKRQRLESKMPVKPVVLKISVVSDSKVETIRIGLRVERAVTLIRALWYAGVMTKEGIVSALKALPEYQILSPDAPEGSDVVVADLDERKVYRTLDGEEIGVDSLESA